jgi:uncharacterized cofD-like protein
MAQAAERGSLAGVDVVAIGGGHGLARGLAACTLAGAEPTAVVTVADDGGSSGRLRRELGIVPPGDLRMALCTLARDTELAAAWAHRFEAGELAGHTLGNLSLIALAEQAGGDFVAALGRAARLLDCAGAALPPTTAQVQLAGLVDGEQVTGQVRIAQASGRVQRVWLEPADPPACAEAVAAIERSDVVVLGPGSLYTSVIPNLCVPEVAAALSRAEATVVYVANVLTQPGETGELDADGHVAALLEHCPGLFVDAVVAHDGPQASGQGHPIGLPTPGPGLGRVVRADVATRRADGSTGWGHDPQRLATALTQAARRTRPVV